MKKKRALTNRMDKNTDLDKTVGKAFREFLLKEVNLAEDNSRFPEDFVGWLEQEHGILVFFNNQYEATHLRIIDPKLYTRFILKYC